MVRVPFRIQSYKSIGKFYVLPNGSTDVIIAMDYLQAAKAKIDCATGVTTFRNSPLGNNSRIYPQEQATIGKSEWISPQSMDKLFKREGFVYSVVLKPSVDNTNT